MSLRLKILFCAVVILSAACKNDTGSLHLFDANLEGEHKHVITLQTDTSHIGMYLKEIAKDKLIFASKDNHYNYILYQLQKDSAIYLGHFLPCGRGPYEINIPEIGYDPHKDLLTIYAPYNFENKLFHIPFDNYKNLFTPSTWLQSSLPHVPSRTGMEFINDSAILMLNGNKENKFFSVAYMGRDKYYKCLDLPYPPLNEDISSFKKSILFSGLLKKQPEGDTYLYSSSSSKLSFIFNIANDSIKNLTYLSNILPVISIDANGKDYTRAADTEDGCAYLDVTNAYIYIGYNNATLEEVRNSAPFREGYPFYFFDRINVFDWKGNFIKRLVLDKPIANFVVTPDDSAIYASTFGFSGELVTDDIVRIDLQ